ncbi:hypothetical protein ACFQZZ_04605 [Nocardia sp. GCM10030253]
MELLVIIGIALLVGAVVLYRKLAGKGGDTPLSTGNPSANDERTDGRSP